MKKIIAILLCGLLFVGCGSAQKQQPNTTSTSTLSSSSSSEEAMTMTNESDVYTSYWINDKSAQIPYESGTVKINDVYFTEKKEGAYLTTSAMVIFDTSSLSDDEQQWLADDFDVYIGDFTCRLYIDVDGEFEEMDYVDSSTGTINENTPVFMILYQIEDHKHSFNGSEALLSFDFEQDKKMMYTYSLTVEAKEDA